MVINFSKVPVQLSDIPDQWIYKHYLKDRIREPLDGRRIRMPSKFADETTPSMFLYVKNGKYHWKDFCSGKGGNAVELVKELLEMYSGEGIPYASVAKEIRKAYRDWQNQYGVYEELDIESTYSNEEFKCDFRLAEYQDWDINYWSKYGVNLDLLKTYNVYPLQWYQLSTVMNGSMFKTYKKISIRNCYGFFNDKVELLKIYNPYSLDFKHITIKNDLLGRDQLENNHKVCVICSSMKDMLTLKGTGVAVDVVAPISENSYIDPKDIDYLKEIYEHVLTLFDNDRAGILSMIKYKKLFDLDYVHIPNYKDIAEFRECTQDFIYVKHEIAQRINAKINEQHRSNALSR
jgi:hypothetical protein